GNGASVAAIDGGRCVETSMGMTPLEGLVMGTRSGDLDAGILFHLGRAGFTLPELDTMLNRGSGLLGVGGIADMRDIQAAQGEDARLALEVYYHRLRHYLGAYLVHLGGADAIVFTAGVGENSAPTRAAAMAGQQWLGIQLDAARNEAASRDARVISTDDSLISILVVPTNEELEIARQAIALVG
ncbi:MAG: acetate kinase, partial [Rhodoglobus sp.]